MGIVGNQSQRHNFEWNVLAAGALTASGNTVDFENLYGLGAHFFFNVTAVSGTTPTIIFSIDEKDPVSGNYVSILKTASITAANSPNPVKLTVYPGVVAAANSVANDFMPRMWRLSWVITGTTPSITCSVGAAFSSQQGT
jgi:hypothetical protein